jgi:ribosome-associated toxin RatA of RatAB toxin-antitoxin module
MPSDRRMTTVDELVVNAPLRAMFDIAADVERWPAHLAHYRFVKFHERRADGGGTVEMSANRPFGAVDWPTWWTSLMSVTVPGSAGAPAIRFRHIRGVTRAMDVEWTFEERDRGVLVRIVHVWNGPGWPVIGVWAARNVIGPVFVHGIASRTLAGLARAAERSTTRATPAR